MFDVELKKLSPKFLTLTKSPFFTIALSTIITLAICFTIAWKVFENLLFICKLQVITMIKYCQDPEELNTSNINGFDDYISGQSINNRSRKVHERKNRNMCASLKSA